MSNPSGLTDEQVRAISAQIAEERQERASTPKMYPGEWYDIVRQWREEEELAIAYLKHGTVPMPPKRGATCSCGRDYSACSHPDC